MNKINAIVFSQDKAVQLKLFLDSVIKNASGIFDLNVIVNYTENEYSQAYDMVISDPAYSHVNFLIQEEDFKNQTLKLLKTEHEYSCFFLDDDIIYNKIELSDIVDAISLDEDVVCFSLRLGMNTTVCYTLSAENVLKDIEAINGLMKWDWKLRYLDFGYPFSTSGHIFRSKDIYKLVRKSKFMNVDEMEMSLFDFAEMFPRNLMVSYEESKLVNAPAGRVQQSIEEETRLAVKNSEARIRRKKMNEAFLSGNSINLETLDFSEIKGCHQKLDFQIINTDIESTGLDKIAIKQYGKRWNELSDLEQGEINDSIDRAENILKQKEND